MINGIWNNIVPNFFLNFLGNSHVPTHAQIAIHVSNKKQAKHRNLKTDNFWVIRDPNDPWTSPNPTMTTNRLVNCALQTEKTWLLTKRTTLDDNTETHQNPWKEERWPPRTTQEQKPTGAPEKQHRKNALRAKNNDQLLPLKKKLASRKQKPTGAPCKRRPRKETPWPTKDDDQPLPLKNREQSHRQNKWLHHHM